MGALGAKEQRRAGLVEWRVTEGRERRAWCSEVEMSPEEKGSGEMKSPSGEERCVLRWMYCEEREPKTERSASVR